MLYVQSSTHMLCSTFVSAKIRHGNLKTSVFNFCGSMLPGFADFNAKNNKKNLHDCNEYMNNDELRNTLKFSQLSRYANKQATTKLPEVGNTPVPVSVDTSKFEKVLHSMTVKEGAVIDKLARLREAICVFVDLTKKEASKDKQRSKLLFDTINQVKQELNATSKLVQNRLHAIGNTPQKKIVTHRFEPTSKYVLLFIGGLALSLVISIWGNLTQWREHQAWEEADLKYRTLKMVLLSDDPNIRYIEKHFNVQRDENVIDNVRKRVVAYEDSVRHHYEMKQMAAYKDCLSKQLSNEAKRIKEKLNE